MKQITGDLLNETYQYELFRMALYDAQAAKILLNNRFYVHALYLSSQSAEKLTKALFFREGVLTTWENAKNFRHNAQKWGVYWQYELDKIKTNKKNLEADTTFMKRRSSKDHL